MNSTDVTRLRKAGQLEEARELALRLLAEQPEDIWNRRAWAWVLYAFMKKEWDAGNHSAAKAHFDAFEALQMPADDTMLHDSFNHYRLRFQPAVQRAEAAVQNKDYREALKVLWNLFQKDEQLAALPDMHTKIAWEIWHNLRELPPDTGAAIRQVNELTRMYRQLRLLPMPGLVHSVVLSQLLRLPQMVRDNFDFLEWFRFWIIPGHFQEKDLLPYVTAEFQLPSTAEKACNAWSKALVAKARELPEEEMASALDRLETMARQQPSFTWLPYYIGKIRLAASQSKDSARQWLLPFVRLKHTEFWAWDLLADSWLPQDPDAAEACLCKALSCRTEPHFLTKVRLRLIQLLVNRQAYDQAKYEIETLTRLKQERNEQLAGDLIRLPQAPWYAAAVNTGHEAQKAWYRRGAVRAEQLVFANDMLQGPGVIEGIDRNTGAVYFALRPEVRGRFPAKRFARIQFRPGDVFRFKLLKKLKNDQAFWEILAVENTRELPPPEICRDFSGPFQQFGQQPVGKVGEAFVPSHIVRALSLQNGQPATVRAVWALDPKRKEYGWKAVR